MLVDLLKVVFFKLYLNFVGAISLLKEQILDRHRLPNIPGDYSGRTIVITGGSKGIGLEAVKKLLKLKCNVIIGCRGVDHAKNQLAGQHEGQLTVLFLDLMKLESVRAFADQVKAMKVSLHALVNNAGIMFGDRKETEDGYESQFATNYLGHFLLSHLLLKDLKTGRSADVPARIVNVSSIAHYLGSFMDFEDLNLTKFYSPELSYGNSKAAQVMFSQFLDARLSGEGVRVIALHPGIVYTNLYTSVWWVQIFTALAKLVMKTASQGGDTIVHAVLAPELDQVEMTGLYLENSRPAGTSSFTRSLNYQTTLWNKTCQILNIDTFGAQ